MLCVLTGILVRGARGSLGFDPGAHILSFTGRDVTETALPQAWAVTGVITTG